jgi:hypothetical protein
MFLNVGKSLVTEENEIPAIQLFNEMILAAHPLYNTNHENANNKQRAYISKSFSNKGGKEGRT